MRIWEFLIERFVREFWKGDVFVRIDEHVYDLERLQLKIKNMRKSGLTRGGEFSTENLAFKILRNQGYIDRLYQAQAQAQDQDQKLSLP
jgi:hypothetical protein